MMPTTAVISELVARRDRLNAAIAALTALEEPEHAPDPPAHQNGGRTPARGRPAAKSKPAGIHRAPKPGIQRKPAWDVALAEKLWKQGVGTAEIAKRAQCNIDSIYERATRCGWGARKAPQRERKPSPRKSVPSRTDVSRRICEGCHQASTTNPCHCGHIHGA